jgi:20S proteasome alpha/beta subunit
MHSGKFFFHEKYFFCIGQNHIFQVKILQNFAKKNKNWNQAIKLSVETLDNSFASVGELTPKGASPSPTLPPPSRSKW